MNKWVLTLAIASMTCVGVVAQTYSPTTVTTDNGHTITLSSDEAADGFELLTKSPHEVQLNLLSTTLKLHPEIAYSYTINTDMSVGARTSFSLKKDREKVTNLVSGDFQLMPYFRWHFYKGTKGNALRGFYVEGNIAYTYYAHQVYDAYLNEGKITEYVESDNQQSEIGIGIGFGYRWITHGSWTFELGGELGRNLLGKAYGAYGSFIFAIGKRF